VADAGTRGSGIRDIMPGAAAAPAVALGPWDSARGWLAPDQEGPAGPRPSPGLKPCLTPVLSPQGNGICEAVVKTLAPDDIRAMPLPGAQAVPGLTGGRIGDDTDATRTRG